MRTIWNYFITIVFPFIVIILLLLTLYIFPCKIMEILTMLAIIVALFRDDVYSFFVPPRIVITASKGSNHLHIAPARDQRTGQFIENQAWFGVIVENRGRGIAKNVQLIFNGLQSNRVSEIDKFQSLPLIRSWIHMPVVNVLHKKVPIRFDICYIGESNPNILRFFFLSTPNELATINCDQHEESYFEFEVIALSDNAHLARKIIRITYNSNYIQGFNVS